MKKNSKTLLILLLGALAATLTVASGCSRGKFNSNYSSVNGDPLYKYAWHLLNTGQQVFAGTAALAGFDLNMQQASLDTVYGDGVLVQISDDGLEDTHEDLNANFPYLNESRDYTLPGPSYISTTARPSATDDNHGTAVAGLVAAAGFNGLGSRGVAPKAHMVIANFLSDNVSQDTTKYLDQAEGDFDISNMSWGTRQNAISPLDTTYRDQLKTLVTTKRAGKGTLFVKAAGNDFAVLCHGQTTYYCVGNSNFDSDNANPYMIVVAAMNARGQSSSYSSPGADIWISSFGGEYGYDTPAMMTTDRTGCTNGYSKSSATGGVFEKGTSPENPNCNYTSAFNGTSSAAPVLTGAIALMLEVNPNLNWRQVKYILAKTATVDNYATGSITHPASYTLPSGYVWEQKWITNGAGFKFQNWYGFGRVNVDAAIAMARTFITSPVDLGTYTETNFADVRTGLTTPVPDFSATGATASITVSTDLTIEAVQIQTVINHPDISELALELTSPAGTKSILINGRNALTGIANYNGETFLSNAFYQEHSVGTWTLKVVDLKAGNSAVLNSFKISFSGGVP